MSPRFLRVYPYLCALITSFALESTATEVAVGKWTPVEAIHRVLKDRRASSPRISTNEKGDRIATWRGLYGVKTWQHTGYESAPLQIQKADWMIRSQAGIDKNGAALVVFTNFVPNNPDIYRVWWAHKPAKSALWSVPEGFDEASGPCKHGQTARLEMTPSGNALAAWLGFGKNARNEKQVTICSRRYDGKKWTKTQPLVSRRGIVDSSTGWAIDTNEKGQAAVAWVTGPSSKEFGRIGAVVYDTHWSNSLALGEKTFKHNMQNVSVKVGKDFAFVSWRQCKTIEPEPKGCEIWAQVYEFAKSRWHEPVAISSDLKWESRQPFLAVAGNTAVIAWTQYDPSQYGSFWDKDYVALCVFEKGTWRKPVIFYIKPERIKRKHWKSLERVRGVAVNDKGQVWLTGLGNLSKVYKHEYNVGKAYAMWFGQSSVDDLHNWVHHSPSSRVFVRTNHPFPNISLALSKKGNLTAVWDGEFRKGDETVDIAFRGIMSTQFLVKE